MKEVGRDGITGPVFPVPRIPKSFCVSIKTNQPAGPGQSPRFFRRGSSEFS